MRVIASFAHAAGHRWAVVRARSRKRYKALRKRADTLWLRCRSLPPLWRCELKVENPNTLFSRAAVRRLHGHIQRMVHRDRALAARLAERRIAGLRGWEYGMLLGVLRNYPERHAWRALDVGTGNSSFPSYLLSTGNVGSMTTFDLPASFEHAPEDTVVTEQIHGIDRVYGSMLDMSFEEGSFDLVTCISAIEHLDGDPTARKRGSGVGKVPYDRYLAETRQALEEMASVLRPGGLLYLTTDAYLPELQTTDAWSSPDGSRPIWSAYSFEDVEGSFVETLERCGLVLVGGHDYSRELILRGTDRSSYRGRYFTTFAVCARKG